MQLNKIAILFQKENSLTKNDGIDYKNKTLKGCSFIQKTRYDTLR